MTVTALLGASIFDGRQTKQNHALLIEDGRINTICEAGHEPENCQRITLNGGTLMPGLVDLQVNGGGGVMLNDKPTVEGIQTICDAHGRCGTTSLLPTLITASRDITTQAINAAIEAYRQHVPGYIGLHLEGPHLSVAKKGAHSAALIRPMDNDDLEQYLGTAEQIPLLKLTVAPESVSTGQIRTLTDAGIIVSLGHSNATYEQCMAAFDAGAVCATHLFNAMSPLTHREPGLVGAALAHHNVCCGLIADGHHVHIAAIKHALTAKHAAYPIFLVSDAMSPIGTTLDSFSLDNRTVFRKDGKLVLADGTLAGADITLLDAVKFMAHCGVSNEQAITMATTYPASLYARKGRNELSAGTLTPGQLADVVYTDDAMNLLQVWRQGTAMIAA